MLSNSQAVMADTIGDMWMSTRKHRRLYIESYLTLGDQLRTQKSQLPHGVWGEFVERTGIPVRTAQRAMRLAVFRLKYDTVSYFGGIRKALERAETCMADVVGHDIDEAMMGAVMNDLADGKLTFDGPRDTSAMFPELWPLLAPVRALDDLDAKLAALRDAFVSAGLRCPSLGT